MQEGLVRSDRFDAPVKCTTVLVSERTDGPKTEEDWRAAQASPSTPLPAPHSGGHCRARSAAPNQQEIQHHCPHPRWMVSKLLLPVLSLASILLLVKCRSVFFSFYSGMFSNIQLLIRFPQPQLPRLGPRWCLQESAVTSSLPSAVDTGRCKLTTTTTTVGDQN